MSDVSWLTARAVAAARCRRGTLPHKQRESRPRLRDKHGALERRERRGRVAVSESV
jgi:hypothetical protein